jgi:nitrile hydratase
MHGMGPIQYERNEPVFHEPWEGRIFALNRAMSAWRKWNIDAFRHTAELIPAPEYLRISYYERWLHSLIELLVKGGQVTRAEVENGKPAPGSPRATPTLTAGAVSGMLAKGKPASRDVQGVARFNVGQTVRARKSIRLATRDYRARGMKSVESKMIQIDFTGFARDGLHKAR